jgi:hypothetical protein
MSGDPYDIYTEKYEPCERAIEAWKRAEGSLRVNPHWSNKKHWYGFALAMSDYHLISHDDYRWLIHKIKTFKGNG